MAGKAGKSVRQNFMSINFLITFLNNFSKKNQKDKEQFLISSKKDKELFFIFLYLSRNRVTVDFLVLKPDLMSKSSLTRWSVVLRCFLKPACSGLRRL